MEEEESYNREIVSEKKKLKKIEHKHINQLQTTPKKKYNYIRIRTQEHTIKPQPCNHFATSLKEARKYANHTSNHSI